MGQTNSTITYYTCKCPLVVYPDGKIDLLKNDEVANSNYEKYRIKMCVLFKTHRTTSFGKWVYKVYDNPYIILCIENIERKREKKDGKSSELSINESIDETKGDNEIDFIKR